MAVDSRVTAALPDWLGSWKNSGVSITTSNDLTLILYKKNVKSGESVTLGTNGGNTNSVNYIVLAVNEETVVKGDVNCDGVIDIFDLASAKRGIISGFTNAVSFDAADIDSDGKAESDDLQQLQDFLIGKINEFAESAEITGERYMAQVSANILESEPSDATEEKSGVTYGTFEKITIDSEVCKRSKNFNVLLPAGYSTNKKYPVLYVLHGYWDDENALLDTGDSSLKLRQIIGNAIAAGEAEDMIVVFPDIYASDTQDF